MYRCMGVRFNPPQFIQLQKGVRSRATRFLVRIRSIIEMIWWIGLAPWEFEFPSPGSLISLAPLPTVSQGYLQGVGDIYIYI